MLTTCHLPPFVAGPRNCEHASHHYCVKERRASVMKRLPSPPSRRRGLFTLVCNRGVLQSLVGADSQSETVAGAWPIRRQPIGISHCVVGTLPTGESCTRLDRRPLVPYFPVETKKIRTPHRHVNDLTFQSIPTLCKVSSVQRYSQSACTTTLSKFHRYKKQKNDGEKRHHRVETQFFERPRIQCDRKSSGDPGHFAGRRPVLGESGERRIGSASLLHNRQGHRSEPAPLRADGLRELVAPNERSKVHRYLVFNQFLRRISLVLRGIWLSCKEFRHLILRGDQILAQIEAMERAIRNANQRSTDSLRSP